MKLTSLAQVEQRVLLESVLLSPLFFAVRGTGALVQHPAVYSRGVAVGLRVLLHPAGQRGAGYHRRTAEAGGRRGLPDEGDA